MLKRINLYKLIPSWLKIIIFKIGGKKPWSKGYFTFKFQYIKKIINNQEIMQRFKNSESLPEGYGYAIDERAVEYPWVLSRIPDSSEGNLLDAGSVLNFEEILKHEILENKKITIVNLNPESNCFWQNGISYVFADIRELPLKDDCFDLITCISTLEHIGMDNVLYTKDSKYKEEKIFDFEKAVLELKRVLKKGGKLFISVPFGKYQNFGRFQQFDLKLVYRVLEIFGPKEYKINYYKYKKEGWNISSEVECKDVEYFDIFNQNHVIEIRSITCIEMTK